MCKGRSRLLHTQPQKGYVIMENGMGMEMGFWAKQDPHTARNKTPFQGSLSQKHESAMFTAAFLEIASFTSVKTKFLQFSLINFFNV